MCYFCPEHGFASRLRVRFTAFEAKLPGRCRRRTRAGKLSVRLATSEIRLESLCRRHTGAGKSSFVMKHLALVACGLVATMVDGCGSDSGGASTTSSGSGGASASSAGGSSGEASTDATGGQESSAGGTTSNIEAGGSSSIVGGIGGTNSASTPTDGGSISAIAGSSGTSPSSGSPYSGKLVINEVCPSNRSGAVDEGGGYADWLELYNATSEAISLSGFYLSDSHKTPTKAALSSSLSIKAGRVLLLWADGDTTQGILHLPYKLSAAGEGLYLSDPDQKLIDSVKWDTATPDASYSRLPDGTGAFVWCSWGTPNKLNGPSCPTD
jgi:hypothetical protein